MFFLLLFFFGKDLFPRKSSLLFRANPKRLDIEAQATFSQTLTFTSGFVCEGLMS